MFKKLLLTALLVPSTLLVASQPPVPPVQTDSICGNLYDSYAGFAEGIYKTGLAASRFTLSASRGAAVTGNWCADNHLLAGGLTTAALAGFTYWYFKRPSRPAWINHMGQRANQMWHDGTWWFRAQ